MPIKVLISEKSEGIFTVVVEGSMDSGGYLILEKDIAPLLISSTKTILMDMKEVSYISSLGVGLIFKIKKFLESNNGVLMMSSLKPQIKKVFEVVAALPTMKIFTSMLEADAYLDRIQALEIEKDKKIL